ncbi:MAG: hypothetical protein K5673_00875 [Lachnospiraceae bacterium]|nr:hypothetical protein [Lachnospiraceae bacterium]
MTRTEAIKVIKTAAAHRPAHIKNLEYEETVDGYRYVWRLPIVMMAIHLEMYDEAYILLTGMRPSQARKQFEGEWESKAVDQPGGNDTSCLRMCYLLLAHQGVPARLLRAIWDVWTAWKPNEHLFAQNSIGCRVLLNAYMGLFSGHVSTSGQSYGYVLMQLLSEECDMAGRLYRIHICCPGMVNGFYSVASPIIQVSFSDRESQKGNNKIRLQKLNELLSTLYDCYENSHEDLDSIFGSFNAKFRSTPGSLADCQAEYTEYYTLLHKYADTLMNGEGSEYLADRLFCEAADLYVIWTNRDKAYPKEVRKVAGELIRIFATDLRRAVGDDPIGYLVRACGIDRLDATLQLGCLIQNVAGLPLRPDMRDKYGRELLENIFVVAANHPDVKTTALIETLEQFDEVTGTDETDPAFVTIVDNIMALNNAELMEVSLRRGLISPASYEYTISRARLEAPALLPCLLAYREASRQTVS